MLETLLIICGLIWLPILFCGMARRGVLVLLIWLFIGPFVSNLVHRPDENPLFKFPAEYSVEQVRDASRSASLGRDDSKKLDQVLDPTRLLIGGFLLVFLYNAIRRKERLGPFDRTEMWMGAFSVIVLTNALFRSNTLSLALQITAGAFIAPFLGYFIARRLIVSEDRLRNLTKVLGYVGLYAIVFSLAERLVNTRFLYRLGGPFYSPISLYFVLATVFLVVLMDSVGRRQAFEDKQAFPGVVRWFVLFLAPVIILLTWSRGNWVGFLMGVWIFLLLGWRLVPSSRKLLSIGLALLLVPIIAIGLNTLHGTHVMEERISHAGTVYTRLGAWKVIMQEVRENPVFGIGLNKMREVLATRRIRFEGVKSETSSHNSFLSLLGELGFLGLLAYCAFVVTIIRRGLRLYRTGTHVQDRWRGVTVVAIMVAYLVPALFANTLYSSNSLIHLYVYVFVGAVSGLYGGGHTVPVAYASRENHRWTSKEMPAVTR